jgi:branched-chain amino acid transport system permease protein
MIYIDAIIYSNLITILVIGFTLTYMIAKIPNFAHGTYAVIGSYVTFTLVEIFNLNPYLGIPLAFLIVGLITLLQYYLVIRPMIRLRASMLSLMIATIAMEIILSAFIGIYVEYISRNYGKYGVYPSAFIFRGRDFKIFDLPGILVISTVILISLVLLLHIMLTRSKIGIALRALVEDSELASNLGINTDLLNALAWFLIGGLAGMAGSMFPLYIQVTPLTGTYLIITIFAGSMLGGIYSIYGAIVGGYIMGLTETFGVIFLADILGVWVTAYRLLISLSILIAILLVLPKGISGLLESYIESRILKRISR